jgi:hypothetical protein
MKKFITNTIIHFAILFVLANIISFISLKVLRNSDFYKPSFLVNSFNQDEKFDYIILGSSRGLTTLNSNQIDDSLKTYGINLSMDDTGVGSHYLMLEHFLKMGFKTDIVILNVDPWNTKIAHPIIKSNDHRFLPFIDMGYVQDYYSKLEKGLTVLSSANYFPLLSVAYYNLEIFFPSIYVLDNRQKRNHFDKKGNFSYPNTYKELQKGEKRKTTKLRFINPYLEKIEHLCDINNITLIYYVAPMFKTKLSNVNYPNKIIIDHSKSISAPALFYDNKHVNKIGRKIITALFITKLKQLGLLQN